jgi:hypothetical protein
MKSSNYEFEDLQFSYRTVLHPDFKNDDAGKFVMTFSNLSKMEADDFNTAYEDLNPLGDLRKFVGFQVEMKRKMSPFVMKYYLPAAGIVIVSEMSFLISPSQLPGRVALLVTLFLVLTNIFTRQQVVLNYFRNFKKKNYANN